MCSAEPCRPPSCQPADNTAAAPNCMEAFGNFSLTHRESARHESSISCLNARLPLSDPPTSACCFPPLVTIIRHMAIYHADADCSSAAANRCFSLQVLTGVWWHAGGCVFFFSFQLCLNLTLLRVGAPFYYIHDIHLYGTRSVKSK